MSHVLAREPREAKGTRHHTIYSSSGRHLGKPCPLRRQAKLGLCVLSGQYLWLAPPSPFPERLFLPFLALSGKRTPPQSSTTPDTHHPAGTGTEIPTSFSRTLTCFPSRQRGACLDQYLGVRANCPPCHFPALWSGTLDLVVQILHTPRRSSLLFSCSSKADTGSRPAPAVSTV